MNQAKLTSLGVLAAMAMLASCDEGMDFGEQTGTISPVVSYDATIVSARNAGSRAGDFTEITVDDLMLTITSADGKINEQFSGADFPADKPFPVGKYTMTASYGSADEEGFDKLSVYGEAELSVSEGKATRVELTAVPTKALVGVEFDESLTNYMTNLKATVHSTGGQYIEYASEETRCAFVKPGEVTLDVSFTKPNGKSGTIEAAKFTAEARHRYMVGVKLGGNGSGTAESITITFDETLEQDSIEINISDLVLNVPAPEVTLSGVANGETVSVVEGSSLAAPLRFDIKAAGGIKSAVLTTTGTGLLELGWPAEIDLAAATEAEQQTLTRLGFKNIGIFRNPGKLAAFELTEVAKHIPATVETASPVTFALKVTDKNGKVASEEPLSFGLKVDKLALTLEPLEGYAYAGEETVDVLVGYNGTEALQNLLKVQYLNRNGVFAPATIASVKAQSRAAQSYVVSINVPADAQLPITVKAEAGSVKTGEVTIPAAAAPTVSVNANDVYARQAWVSVSAEGYDVASKAVAVEISTDGKTFTKATGEQNGAEFHITGGLNPATTYTVRASVGALVSNTTTFTTEAPVQIENGNLDSWTTQSHSHTFTSWTEYIPGSWGTLNALTFSEESGSCLRSAAQSIESTDDSHSGKAAAIRTVGWGASTTFVSPCPKHTAGELYLGSYNNGAQYGTPFTSRPSAVKFWCKFAKFSDGETGVAEARVMDADGNVIASGTLYPSNSDYQQLTINLNYERGVKKAATLSVKFKSNAKESLSGSDVTSYRGGNASVRPAGSVLYIDDVELVY